MNKRNRLLATSAFAIALSLWIFAFASFRNAACELFPSQPFKLYELTDKSIGGFSTSELSKTDSVITASINVRSGSAYPAVGMEFNLQSSNHRPAGFFDFSQYDTLEIMLATSRMKSVNIQILVDDPVYTQGGNHATLRPLTFAIQSGRSFASTKIALSQFRTSEWWLSQMGMDSDDGRFYFQRGAFLDIANGNGIFRGIPDEISVKQIRLYGTNHNFVKAMYIILAALIVLAALVIVYAKKKRPVSKELKTQLEQAAILLKTTDKSIAEISIAIGEKSPSTFEKKFIKLYGKKPLQYRREHV